MNIQSAITTQTINGNGLEPTPISIISPILIVGIVTLVFYLNSSLFWVKEQGEMVFILRKYDTVPLSKKGMYTSKFKIIISNLLTFLFGAIVIYIVMLLLNSYFVVDIMFNLWEVFLLLLLSTISLIVILIIDLFQDAKTKREI